MEQNELVTSLKFNKFLLIEVEDNEINKTMMSKKEIKNCLVIYSLLNIFNISSSIEASMSLIERCFPTFADSDNFLELDVIYVRKILLSSGLNIDSELQVYNAADSWLCHDITERSKYAKELLSKVRLALLSVPALEQVLGRVSSKYHECDDIIKGVLVKKQQLKSTSCKTTTRYCNQSNFSIVVCGGRNIKSNKPVTDVKSFFTSSLREVNNLPQMNNARKCFSAVYIRDEVYVLGGIGDDYKVVSSVKKLSSATNTWKHVVDMMDNRTFFSACSFMDSVYIMGGILDDVNENRTIATCLELNTKSHKWKEILRMSNARKHSACSVFEGRIFVSGGFFGDEKLSIVEAYDHVGGKWEKMPSMIQSRSYHKSVAVKNKLFVTGGYSRNNFEVFDSTTCKFTLLKLHSSGFRDYLHMPFGAITIGNKVFVFTVNSKVISYDFENDEWSVEICEATKSLIWFSCAKIPVKTGNWSKLHEHKIEQDNS